MFKGRACPMGRALPVFAGKRGNILPHDTAISCLIQDQSKVSREVFYSFMLYNNDNRRLVYNLLKYVKVHIFRG